MKRACADHAQPDMLKRRYGAHSAVLLPTSTSSLTTFLECVALLGRDPFRRNALWAEGR
jgi:hypothetical protein